MKQERYTFARGYFAGWSDAKAGRAYGEDSTLPDLRSSCALCGEAIRSDSAGDWYHPVTGSVHCLGAAEARPAVDAEVTPATEVESDL